MHPRWTTGLDDRGPAVHLIPHPERDVVLAKLATPATGITPVPVSDTAPFTGRSTIADGPERSAWGIPVAAPGRPRPGAVT